MMRIISLVPSHTEIIFDLGLGSSLVGVTEHCDYPLEVAGIEKVGFFGKPDVEKIISLKPDLVLTGGRLHRHAVRRLTEAGICAFEFEPATVEELLQGMARILQMTGGTDQRGSVDILRKRLNMIRNMPFSGKGIRTAFVMGEETLAIPGPANCQFDALKICGCEPMPVKGAVSFEMVTWEKVADFDPEIILACGRSPGEPHKKRCPGCHINNRPCARDVGSIRNLMSLVNVAALRNGHIYTVPCHFFCRPGRRLFNGMEWLAKIVRDMQMKNVVRAITK